MTAMIGWQNNVTTGALSATTAALPVSNLQNDLGNAASGWQSTATTYQTITIDAGSAVSWRTFVLARTNLTAAAYVRWQVAADSGFTMLAYDTGYIAAGVVPGYGQSVVVAPASVTGEYCSVTITDPTNPDGFINIALAYAGDVWTPASNISFATTFGRDDTTTETVTRGGQEYPLPLWQRRRWNIDLQGVRTSEVWPQAMALDTTARRGGNVLLIPDSTSATICQETVFGRLKATADMSYPYGSSDRRAWRANVTERL